MGWKWRSARRRRLARLVADVADLRPALDEERRTPHTRRTTGASNSSVLDAVDRAEAAWSRLSWSDPVAGGLEVRALARGTHDWAPAAALTGQVRELARVAEGVLDDHPDDPRLAPPPPPPTRLHPRDPRLEPAPPATSEFLLPDAQDLPTVIDRLRSGDDLGAIKEYRALTGSGLRDAQAAVDWAARRLGLPETGR